MATNDAVSFIRNASRTSFPLERYRSNVTKPPGARSRPVSTAKRLIKARQLLPPTLDESAVVHLRTQLTRPNRPVSTLLDPWYEEE